MFKYLFLLSIISITPKISASDPEGIAYDWHWPASYGELVTWSKIASYKMASYLTDPLCKAREYSIRSQILEDLPPSTLIKNPVEAMYAYVKYMQLTDESWLTPNVISQFTEKCFLLGGAAFFSALTPITALPAMVLRFAASNLESDRFIHYTGRLEEQQLLTPSLTHMQWNICGVKGGYDIEEGGQMPIRDDLLPFSENRIVKVGETILKEDPDILCLNEVFDINDAIYLVETLQNKYAHFVIHCGARTQGLNSGLFFASKFAIKDIAFTPFPKEFLFGNTKYAEKGFLTVRTYDKSGPIGLMILTHLQHSDEPQFPTTAEQIARSQELNMILQAIFSNEEEHVILAGDLNLDDEELEQLNPNCFSQFKKTVNYTSPLDEETKTWLGDHWYAEYGNRESTFSLISARTTGLKRKVSKGLNLDHALVKIRSNESLSPEITTTLKSTGYDPSQISRDSLSDHMILFSTITLPR